ncbi:hypothetical protein KSS94_22210 [Pseudomonas fakonensis]|uniref:Uncharacterized protein n=1 Tax=Pseudomonas fakonensis TaxID=2842355 RepID=A0ABX8N2R7_9PSED|nr:hypothetical protein [Pseudomonas fakonensis]QXH50633.1 hypothetical protein KSS94_22210 [Pseudomonas fakonensis]
MSTYNQAVSFIAILSCDTSKGSGTLTAGKLKGAKGKGGYYGDLDIDRSGDVCVCNGARDIHIEERFWFGCFNRGEPERYDVRSWAPGKPHHGRRLAVASDGRLCMAPAAGNSCDWILSWDGQPFQRRHVIEMGGAAYGFAMSHVTAGSLRHEAPIGVRTGWHGKMHTSNGELASLQVQIVETWAAQP